MNAERLLKWELTGETGVLRDNRLQFHFIYFIIYILMMELARPSWMSVNTYKTTRCHIPEDHNRHSHRCENLKPHTLTTYVYRTCRYSSCQVLLCGGTLDTAATTGLLYQPRMISDDDCGEIGGMMIGRGNRSTRRKPAPAPLCSPQNLTWPRPGFEPGPSRWEASD
jgi:hypothetical protein